MALRPIWLSLLSRIPSSIPELRKACGVVRYEVWRPRKACGVVKYEVWRLRKAFGIGKYEVWRPWSSPG